MPLLNKIHGLFWFILLEKHSKSGAVCSLRLFWSTHIGYLNNYLCSTVIRNICKTDVFTFLLLQIEYCQIQNYKLLSFFNMKYFVVKLRLQNLLIVFLLFMRSTYLSAFNIISVLWPVHSCLKRLVLSNSIATLAGCTLQIPR
jgi:hypothetical protein